MSNLSPTNKPMVLPVTSDKNITSFKEAINYNDMANKSSVIQLNVSNNTDKNPNLLNQILNSLSSLQNEKSNLELANNYLFRKNKEDLTKHVEEKESFQSEQSKKDSDSIVKDIQQMDNNVYLYKKHLNWTMKFNMLSGISESFKNSINKFLQM
jgi:hypothetical protein